MYGNHSSVYPVNALHEGPLVSTHIGKFGYKHPNPKAIGSNNTSEIKFVKEKTGNIFFIVMISLCNVFKLTMQH